MTHAGDSALPVVDARAYWPFYCEENAWHRCRALAPGTHAVFVTGVGGAVMMAAQRAGFGADSSLGWDYHVFTVIERAGAVRVHDPDHVGGEPVPFATYVARSFPHLERGLRRFAPRFRVVDGMTFAATFASDRSHMRTDSGTWTQPPPPWPAPGDGMNLSRFIDMNDAFVGERMDLEGFRRRFEVPTET